MDEMAHMLEKHAFRCFYNVNQLRVTSDQKSLQG